MCADGDIDEGGGALIQASEPDQLFDRQGFLGEFPDGDHGAGACHGWNDRVHPGAIGQAGVELRILLVEHAADVLGNVLDRRNQGGFIVKAFRQAFQFALALNVYLLRPVNHDLRDLIILQVRGDGTEEEFQVFTGGGHVAAGLARFPSLLLRGCDLLIKGPGGRLVLQLHVLDHQGIGPAGDGVLHAERLELGKRLVVEREIAGVELGANGVAGLVIIIHAQLATVLFKGGQDQVYPGAEPDQDLVVVQLVCAALFPVIYSNRQHVHGLLIGRRITCSRGEVHGERPRACVQFPRVQPSSVVNRAVEVRALGS